MTDNKTIVVKECTEAELREYLQNERLRRVNEDIVWHENCLLQSDDNLFTLQYLYQLFLDGVVVGFAVMPTYTVDVLSRIYIQPEARRKGVGKYTIDYLQIRNLSCLTVNKEGLLFYESMGFVGQGSAIYATTFKRN